MSAPAALALVFEWDGLTLAGTLTLPAGPGPHPAVLMMQGSGPADRDCDGYFEPIRQAFLDRRLATFSFDKPGCGASSGDWRDYGLEGRADQASAAVQRLRAHVAVDGTRVGVWGQSQGGWLAQILGSRLPELAFVIANSGPSIGVREQDLYGCEHTMRSEGQSEAAIEAALTFIRAVHQAAEADLDYEMLDPELIEGASEHPYYGGQALDEGDWRLMRLFIREAYDPVAALAQIRSSFLAIFGALDVLVPAWQSAEECSRALQQSGNGDAAVVVFPTGNHRIKDATGDFVSGYLDLLGDWASRRVH